MFEFESLRKLVEKEQIASDALIQKSLASKVELINQIGQHIINSGGKRLRPLLVLLGAKAFGVGKTFQEKNSSAHIALSATIELLHTATLLHDDVVDHSSMRRGKLTSHEIWGENASVLVGDYLYSRAFQLMVSVENMKVMEIMAGASNQMAEGEVLQLVNCHNPDVTEEDYMKVIYAKTATLFAAAAQIGPVLANASVEQVEMMSHYGSHLGTAFQLVDDALDYSASSASLGKNIGDDLREGKPTLPLIRALVELKSNQQPEAEVLREAIREGKSQNVEQLIHLVHSTDAISYTYEVAKKEAEKAKKHLHFLPASEYREGLMQLIEFALARYY